MMYRSRATSLSVYDCKVLYPRKIKFYIILPQSHAVTITIEVTIEVVIEVTIEVVITVDVTITVRVTITISPSRSRSYNVNQNHSRRHSYNVNQNHNYLFYDKDVYCYFLPSMFFFLFILTQFVLWIFSRKQGPTLTCYRRGYQEYSFAYRQSVETTCSGPFAA